jgi:hypothetical protein
MSLAKPMEADWEIEIGGGAPVIEAHWPGFVDLRLSPERARLLAEAQQLPGLAEALVRLNAPNSLVWTSKCDVFMPDEFDPDELNASPEIAAHALACYIDLLPRSGELWSDPTAAAAWCRSACADIKVVPIRCCRADLVVRRALIAPELMGLGITAYLTACGLNREGAASILEAALNVFANSFGGLASAEKPASKLQ